MPPNKPLDRAGGQGGEGCNGVQELVLAGNKLKVSEGVTGDTKQQLEGARVTAITVAATGISDFGFDQFRTRNFSSHPQLEFLAKNSYQYSKTVQIPNR